MLKYKICLDYLKRFLVFETGSHSVAQAGLKWDPPASVFQVMGLLACVPMHSLTWKGFVA